MFRKIREIRSVLSPTGESRKGALTEDQVAGRLGAYRNSEVDVARDLCMRVMDSEDRWIDLLDRKAQVALAFAGTFVTIVVPWVGSVFGSTQLGVGLLVAGAVAALGSMAAAYAVLHARSASSWSDAALVPKPVLTREEPRNSPAAWSEEPRISWARAAFELRSRNREVLRAKSYYIRPAFRLLVFAVVLVLLSASYSSVSSGRLGNGYPFANSSSTNGSCVSSSGSAG